MTYQSSVGFTDSADNQKNFNQKYSNDNPGPYVGTIKFVVDPLRMGRLGVNIPALSNTTSPSANQIIWCQYLSPFYGAKSIEAVSKTDPFDYKETQHSYGLWAVPPDIDTDVLVLFAKGEKGESQAYWIGCIQKPLVNQQIPAHGASTNTSMPAGGADYSQSKEDLYGTSSLPSGEKNMRTYRDGETLANVKGWKYPVNNILADQMEKQGLVQDPVRGTITSSARRESPSKVFGISTPGAVRSDSRTLNIGINNTPIKTDRNPGHSFVMDDGDTNEQNQLTRIRTASGHQILMHDTEGTVYIANGSGKAFIEMEKDGTISVFSDGGINMRTKQDFNLHSDRNVNFHAKGSLNFTAEQNVNLNGGFNVNTMAKNSINNSSQGAVRSYAATQITSFTSGTQMHGAGGNIDLAGAEVHMNSQGARSGWGPSWLVPEHDQVGIRVSDGLIDIDTEKPFKQGKDNKIEANKIENSTTVSDFVTHEPYTRTSSTAIRKKYINDIIASITAENPSVSAQDLNNIKKRLLSKDSISAVTAEINKIVSVNKVTDFASTEIKKLVGNNVKLDLSQMNSIQQLLVKPNIADVSGQIKKIVGNNVKLDLSQLNSVKTQLMSKPSIADVSGKVTDYAKNTVGLSVPVSLNISSLNDLKSKATSYQSTITNMAAGFVQGKIAQYGKVAFKAVTNFFKGFSDSRLKENIKFIGKSPSGINIYSFKYKQSVGTYEGVMAQEVPWAREMTDTGFYMVDYSKVDVEFRRLN